VKNHSHVTLKPAVCPNVPAVADPVPYPVVLFGRFPRWPVNRLFANFAGTGGRVEQLLRKAGIDPGSHAVGGDIASAELVQLLRRAAWAAQDETWGLRPSPTRLGTFKLACRLAVHGRTVEQGLRAAFRYYHGVVDDFTIRLSISGDRGTISIVDRELERPARDTLHILMLHFIIALVEWLAGRPMRPESILLRHDVPPHVEQLEGCFRAAVTGNAPITQLVLPAALLRRPVVSDAEQATNLIDTMLVKVAMLLPDPRSLVQKAAGYIVAKGDWHVPREEVAAVLGLSAATFNRRLHDETGGGFQSLKDHLRQDAARELIALEGLTLDEIARRLGFSELSSFHRAFKRWNCLAPSIYRDRLRQSPKH
jgi:AraC-like DNA-binding protein